MSENNNLPLWYEIDRMHIIRTMISNVLYMLVYQIFVACNRKSVSSVTKFSLEYYINYILPLCRVELQLFRYLLMRFLFWFFVQKVIAATNIERHDILLHDCVVVMQKTFLHERHSVRKIISNDHHTVDNMVFSVHKFYSN